MDMLGMCQALHDLGHEVDLVYTAKSQTTPVDDARLSRACHRHWKIMRNTGVLAALSSRPYQIASRAGLMTHAFADTYDVVIASDHCSGALLNPSLAARHWILRRNNAEADYALRMAEEATSFAQKLFFWKESHAFRRWHQRMDGRADQIWYVSTEELRKQSGTARATAPDRLLVPSALGDRHFEPVDIERMKRRRVLYFGSLTIPINRKSVDWFVTEIHPRLRETVPGYHLVIAGRVDDGLQSWVAQHQMRDDYAFLPSPADADALYQPGGIFIDPLAHDAGIKLKILEAVRRGYAIVCSSNSLQGSGLSAGDHARTADTADDFFHAVAHLLTHPNDAAALANRAQKQMRAHFAIDASVSHALGLLNVRAPLKA